MDIYIKQSGEIDTLTLIDFTTKKNVAAKFLSRWFGINNISTLVTHKNQETNGQRYDCVGSPQKGQRVMHHDDFEMYRELLEGEQTNIDIQERLSQAVSKTEYSRLMRKINKAFDNHMSIDSDAIFCMQAAIENKNNMLNDALVEHGLLLPSHA